MRFMTTQTFVELLGKLFMNIMKILQNRIEINFQQQKLRH